MGFRFELRGNMPVVKGVNKPLSQITYSKPNKIFIAKVVKEEKSYTYLHYIIWKIIVISETKNKASERNRLKRQFPLVSR